MSEAQVVRYEVEDGVGVITVDNPPVNALGPGVRERIARDGGPNRSQLVGDATGWQFAHEGSLGAASSDLGPRHG